ncbi:MAG: MOSC domain-containing protein [Deltaproteobacteria bacterium]|nr:MOSC domain-containing protein [Deltaproteobacteria bacterium]
MRREPVEKTEDATNGDAIDAEAILPVPAGDPALHLPREALIATLRAHRPPRDVGRVVLLVARAVDHARSTPARVLLQPNTPLPGDRWDPANKYGTANQLSVMDAGVARAVCNGQDLTLPGDNLLLDLDLSEANLPVGSVLQVGAAACEVTEKAHTGCKLYTQRFGIDAMRLTADEQWKASRLRGLFLRVLRPGEVAVGDEVRVVARGPRET